MGIQNAKFRDGDICISYDYENVLFRYDHISKKSFRKFLGESQEHIVPHNNQLFNEAVRFGREINLDSYNNPPQNIDSLSKTGAFHDKPRLSTSYNVLRVATQHTEDIPPAPGTMKIPADHVRLYHYISSQKGGQSSESQEKMAENLRRGGIDITKARGSTYGEPNVVWASTKPPGKHKVFAEFNVHKDDPRWLIGRPKTPGDVDWLNKANIDVTFGGSIKPEEIVAVHLPWHNTYRYLKEHNMFSEVLNGDYDYLLSDPEMDEAKAINYIKSRHGYT